MTPVVSHAPAKPISFYSFPSPSSESDPPSFPLGSFRVDSWFSLFLGAMTSAPGPARRCRIPFTLSGESLEGKVRVFGMHARHPHRGLILIHPLGSLGGSMNDGIVSELWRAAQASRSFGAVLAYVLKTGLPGATPVLSLGPCSLALSRYNQRGVGSSPGSVVGSLASKFYLRRTRGDGEKDATDVLRAIEYLVGVIEEESGKSEQPVEICLVGYSYGAALAAQAIDHPNVIKVIGISPPIGNLASFFLPSQQHLQQLLRIKASDKRGRLLVIGSTDQYTTEQELLDFVLLNAVGTSDVTLTVEHHQEPEDDDEALVRRRLSVKEGEQERLLLEVYSRNDHFWGNDAAVMVERCLSFAAK